MKCPKCHKALVIPFDVCYACRESIRYKFRQYENGLRELRDERDTLRKERDAARAALASMRAELARLANAG